MLSYYCEDWATEAERTADAQKRKEEKCPQTEDIWVIDENVCEKHYLIYFPPPPPHTGQWGSDGTMFGPESEVAEPYMLPQERLDICLPHKEIWEKVAFWDGKIREQRALRREDDGYVQAVRDEAWDKLVKKQKEEEEEEEERDDVPVEERFEMIRPMKPKKEFPSHLQGRRRRF
jgi:hypothetical protein